MKAAPPMTRSGPIRAAIFSSLSTPFCRETTAVVACRSGGSRSTATSVS